MAGKFFLVLSHSLPNDVWVEFVFHKVEPRLFTPFKKKERALPPALPFGSRLCLVVQEQLPLGAAVGIADEGRHGLFPRRARSVEQLEAGLVRETVGLALRMGCREVFVSDVLPSAR